MRWLGFRRKAGPSATKDQAVRTPGQKSQREKSTSDFVSSGADLATYSISSCHFGCPRARHLELSSQARGSKQTPHLVLVGDGSLAPCALRRLGFARRMVEPASVVCPVSARHRCAACSVHGKPAPRLSVRRSHRGLSSGAGNRTPALVLRSGGLVARASILAGGFGGDTDHPWDPARLGWLFRIWRQPEASRAVLGYRHRLHHRWLHPGRWLLGKNPPDLADP